MKSQASSFSFGCLFHQMPFYHWTKTTFFLGGRETARPKQTPNRAKPLHSLKAPWPLRRGQGLLRGFQIQPPPQSDLTCSAEGAWLSKTKTPMKDFPKNQHLLPASYVSAVARLSPREPQAPYVPILAGCCSAPLHIHRITSCAKQAVYVERMPS